jgi:hypothetical protein
LTWFAELGIYVLLSLKLGFKAVICTSKSYVAVVRVYITAVNFSD